jgi:hypothetical protein
MATSLNTQSVHTNLGILSSVGSLLSLIGTSSYFMSYEYSDFSRVDPRDALNKNTNSVSRDKTSIVIAFLSIIAYVAGLILIVLSIGLYRDEKKMIQSSNISEMIKNLKHVNNVNNENSSSVNAPVILSSFASIVTLVGAIVMIKHYKKHRNFNRIGTLLFSSGWLANGFAASMNTKSLSSISSKRLAWTLPGVFAIVAGTFLLPWQISNEYVSGPALPLATIGYILFSIGNISVLN